MVHCVHRNASSHTSTTSEGIVTGSMVHELDIVRWLLDDEVASIRVESPIAEGLRDPQLATIQMRSGVLVSVEVFVNAAYGYDVRCEVVGTSGTVSLVPPTPSSLRKAGLDGVRVRDDFIGRFSDAYRLELGAWAEDALNGVVHGPERLGRLRRERRRRRRCRLTHRRWSPDHRARPAPRPLRLGTPTWQSHPSGSGSSERGESVRPTPLSSPAASRRRASSRSPTHDPASPLSSPSRWVHAARPRRGDPRR